MIKSLKILLGLLTMGLSSFSQKESWDVYLARYEKGIGSTIVDMSLINSAPIKELPILLKAGVKLIKCSEDGLPIKDEFDSLYAISDNVKSIISSNGNNKPAGIFSYQCERTDYYYVNDTIGIRKQLENVFQKRFPKYQYSITIRNDENWEAYTTFLYPNDETFEFMQNEKVIMKLTEQGDKLTKPRPVDHWIYFSTEADRDKFIALILKENFKVEGKEIVKKEGLNYQLHISKIDSVDINTISKITIELRKKAKELNGQYDGWETFLIKD